MFAKYFHEAIWLHSNTQTLAHSYNRNSNSRIPIGSNAPNSVQRECYSNSITKRYKPRVRLLCHHKNPPGEERETKSELEIRERENRTVLIK